MWLQPGWVDGTSRKTTHINTHQHINTSTNQQQQNTKKHNTKQICAYHEWNLDGLVELVWEYLDLVRVYTKPKGKLPDFNEPVVLRRSQCSIEGFCNKLHKTMVKQLKYALVWGSSAKHRPQKVGKDHVLQDEDIVQIVKRV